MARYDPWKGVSSKELLDMPPERLGSLSPRELRAAVTKLASAANKRIRSLEKLPYTSPDLAEVKREGGRFSAKGKTDAQLMMEYQRLGKFMKGETSTVKGARAFKRKTDEELAKRFGLEDDFFSDMDEETSVYFWSLFNELRPLADALGITATDFVAVVNDAMKEFDNREEAYEFVETRLHDIYEEKSKRRREARKRYRNARSNRM